MRGCAARAARVLRADAAFPFVQSPRSSRVPIRSLGAPLRSWWAPLRSCWAQANHDPPGPAGARGPSPPSAAC